MKHTKRFFSVLLALLVLALSVPFAAAEDVTVVDSGTTGYNLTWSLDSEGTLTISGEGQMNGYGTISDNGFYRTGAPWGKYYKTIQSVVIGDSVTSIGSNAFYGCKALESVTIPDGVTSIGDSAFFRCDNLKKIYISDLAAWVSISRLWNLMNYGNSQKELYLNGELLQEVVIPNGVTSIGGYAFYNCTALASVTLPDNISSIGNSAFGDSQWYTLALCNKNTTTAATLAATDFPYAFLDGTDEDNVITEKVNASLSFTIDKRTRTMTVQTTGTMVSFASFTPPWLEYQKYITDVVILPGCTSVSVNAFRRCYNLKRVTLPDGIESIGNSAFYECCSLMQINLPDSVETIGGSAFSYCTALESIDLGSGVTSIGEYAFYNSGLESIVIPDSVNTLSNYYKGSTFADCRSLKTVVIGDGLTAIPYSAFSGCTALETVSIGDGVQEIDSSAFSGCTALETVSIGENVTGIYGYAFSGCTALHTVVLPEKVKTLSSGAFPEKALKNLYIYNAGQCDIAEDAVFYSATIHAYVDSPAATFFENRGYNFEPLTDAPAHEHDSTLVKGTAPTCTEAGLTDGYQCSVCGKWITKQKTIKALGHDYVLKETVLPTDTENGFNRYECSRCDATYTEVIPVSSHAHNYTVTDSRPATCLEDGFTTYVCYGCGHSYTDIVSAPGHTFGNWKTFLPTEAGEKGIDVRFCSVCGVYELRESETTGTGTGTGTETPTDPTHTHTFTLVDAKDATCELAGYKRYICTCGATKAEIIDALEHDYVIGATVPATCNETGYTPFVCSRCGDEKKTDLVPALGHSWNSGYVTKEANCSTTGTILYTCTRDGCGETMEKTLPKNANVHEMKTVIVPATCTEQGYTQHTCLYCRYGFNDTVVPALGHATPDDNGNCPRCGAHVQDVTRPTDPTEPTQEPEEEEEELNFFQRIIEWFRNLFANLFG